MPEDQEALKQVWNSHEKKRSSNVQYYSGEDYDTGNPLSVKPGTVGHKRSNLSCWPASRVSSIMDTHKKTTSLILQAINCGYFSM